MDRKQLKQQARAILKENYGKLLLVCIFVSFTLTFNVKANSAYTAGNYENAFVFHIGQGEECYYMIPYFSGIVLEFMGRGTYLLTSYRMIIALFAGLIFLNIFIVSVISVGATKIMLGLSKGEEIDLSDLFWGFREGRYIHCVDVMFFLKLKIVMWALLFLIPGLIKQYEYYFVPYLLVEHPDWSSSALFRESKKRTENRKMDLFVLSLSFFIFYFISAMTIGLLGFFVEPYYQMTKVFAYRFFQDEDSKQREEELEAKRKEASISEITV